MHAASGVRPHYVPSALLDGSDSVGINAGPWEFGVVAIDASGLSAVVFARYVHV